MELRIHGKGIGVTGGMRAAVERRVRFAFDRFATRVVRIEILFTDVNGPRGGEDKSCAVAVRLRDLPTVRATERSADAYAALDVAVHRAARGVAKAVERERALLLEYLALLNASARSDALSEDEWEEGPRAA